MNIIKLFMNICVLLKVGCNFNTIERYSMFIDEDFSKFENELLKKYSKTQIMQRALQCNYLGLDPHKRKVLAQSTQIVKNSTLFITGALKTRVNDHIRSVSQTFSESSLEKFNKIIENQSNKVVRNIQSIVSYWSSYSIIMYVDNSSYGMYSRFRDPCLYFIHENSFDNRRIQPMQSQHHDHTYKPRTYRLANARNQLIRQVKHMVDLRGDNPRSIYTVMMDFDHINAGAFDTRVFEYAMTNSDRWDVVSFNRHYYYDIWALRYGNYDFNSAYVKIDGNISTPIIQAAIEEELRFAPSGFFPVISAFNGLAIYKFHMMEGCKYYGRNESESGYGEDCEHVSMHKCMIAKHAARIRIYNESLIN